MGSRSLFLFLLLGSFIGCKDAGTEPTETAPQGKLYPYEVTYDAATFRHRRESLMEQVPTGHIVLVTTNDIYVRNGDVNYEFRPASAFFYLTGFEEPNAIGVIRKKPAPATSVEMIMFVQERTGSAVQWNGPVSGTAGVVQYYGADSAYAFESFSQRLGAWCSAGSITGVYANLSDNETVKATFTQVVGSAYPVRSLDALVSALRLQKDPLEIGLIRRAVDVSIRAVAEGIRKTRPLMFEYEMEATCDYVLRMSGCPRTSFPTIVASGPNITTIHYTLNNRQMQSGDLLMVDFGAEYGYYAADITRTIPVGGRFSTQQATLYDIVKSAHDAVIAAASPGASFAALSSLNIDIIVGGLLQNGVISGSKSTIISSGQYRLYVPAGLGHQLGLDVHDPWWREPGTAAILRENMVLAIEPHIYLNVDDMSVAPAYRGVCARIENDILITKTGCEVLSASLPTGRLDIEAMMKK